MGTATSKAIDGPNHATTTAIVTAVNEQQLAHLLPPLLAELDGNNATEEDASSGGPTFLLDLDCGTGHNTLTLAGLTRHWRVPVQLEGWDRDGDKLEIARARCKDVQWQNTNSSVTFSKANHWKRLEIGHPGLKYFRHMYEFVLSSLVMHRMPMDIFFKGIEGLLSRDSVALITCAHPEFIVAERGLTGSENEKREIKEELVFRHDVQDVLSAAKRCGLTLQGAVKEVKLSTEMLGKLEHSEREEAKKCVGRKVWFSVVLGRVTDDKF
ncbi:hypothetical protein MBLNU13_g10120t1 [Cladosporium sp. NU13]